MLQQRTLLLGQAAETVKPEISFTSQFQLPFVHIFFGRIHSQKGFIETYGMRLQKESFQVGSLLHDFYQH